MKRTTAVLFVILSVFVLMFTACNNEVSVPDTEGTLVVKVSGAQARGILPAVSMVTSEYELTICDSLGIPKINTTLDPSETSVSYKLPAGRYTVTIDAKNTDGTVIGSGTESIIVNAGATNTATVTIRETEGVGTFAVSISANDGYALTLKLYNLSNEVIYSGNLVYSEGIYTTDGPIKKTNGFYRFEITRTDTGARVKSDSVRIVNGFTSTYSARFTFSSDGSIAIVNEMINIPTIRISLEDEIMETTDSLVASADISGINDYTACWYVDGVAVGSFGEYADLEYPLSNMENGSHEVTLYVKNSQIIWSESKMFNVGSGRSISLANLAAGGSIEIDGLDADSSIALSGFSLEDGVYIEVVGDGSRGVSRDIVGDVFEDVANLFKRQDGTYIPIPDEIGCAEFVAAAIGVVEDAKVIIHKLDKLETDLEIDPEEYPGLNGVAEEFYYINFYLDPRFRGLNQKEIVLVKSGAVGAQGIAVLQRGMLNTDTEGIIDFSEKGFTGFAVNMHMVLYPESTDTMKLNVLNPIRVGTEAITLKNDLNVIKVEKRQDASEYKVVVSFTGDNAAEVIRNIAMDYNSLQIHPRYANGDNRLPCTFPEFDMDNCTITYHLGKVDETFIFNLDYDSENTGFVSGSASIVLMEDPDGIEIHSLDDIDTSVSLIAESNKFTTWAFFAESPQVLEPERLSHGFINLYSYQEGRGGGSGIPRMLELQGTGFFLMHTDAEEDVCLMTLNRATWKSIDCAAVEWDPDSLEYVCVDDDCEYCAALGKKQHYSRGFIIENRKAIFTKRYITADSFGDYGRIIYGEDLFLEAENKVLNTQTTGGRGHYYPMGTRAWNVDDTDTMVVIELKGIYKNPDVITCNIAIDGTEDFAIDVPMLPEGTPPEKNIVKIIYLGDL